jgi:hypothetical protein
MFDNLINYLSHVSLLTSLGGLIIDEVSPVCRDGQYLVGRGQKSMQRFHNRRALAAVATRLTSANSKTSPPLQLGAFSEGVYIRAGDQGRQGRGQMDKAVMPRDNPLSSSNVG